MYKYVKDMIKGDDATIIETSSDRFRSRISNLESATLGLTTQRLASSVLRCASHGLRRLSFLMHRARDRSCSFVSSLLNSHTNVSHSRRSISIGQLHCRTVGQCPTSPTLDRNLVRQHYKPLTTTPGSSCELEIFLTASVASCVSPLASPSLQRRLQSQHDRW